MTGDLRPDPGIAESQPSPDPAQKKLTCVLDCLEPGIMLVQHGHIVDHLVRRGY